MAEIKSTLHIIMERTKNLTMTDEEKASFRRQEAEGKVKGWIQKYQDGVLELDNVKAEFEKEVRDYPELPNILKSQLLDSVKLNADNGRLLRILRDVLCADTEDIENTIQSFKHKLELLRSNRTESIREELTKRKIYGSSVVPNPDRGHDLREDILKAESDLRTHLKSFEG
jgi:hypothetical protein